VAPKLRFAQIKSEQVKPSPYLERVKTGNLKKKNSMKNPPKSKNVEITT
jgi:hypothetical protein